MSLNIVEMVEDLERQVGSVEREIVRTSEEGSEMISWSAPRTMDGDAVLLLVPSERGSSGNIGIGYVVIEDGAHLLTITERNFETQKAEIEKMISGKDIYMTTDTREVFVEWFGMDPPKTHFLEGILQGSRRAQRMLNRFETVEVRKSGKNVISSSLELLLLDYLIYIWHRLNVDSLSIGKYKLPINIKF